MSRANKTPDEIIADMRRKPCIFGYRDMNELADRLAAAIDRERAEWKERIQDGMEIADAFKKELNHLLDLIAFHAQEQKETEK